MANQMSHQDIINRFANLTTQIANLTAVVTTLAGMVNQQSISSSRMKTIEKPMAFTGKDSQEARMFISAFKVWMIAHENIYASKDAAGHTNRIPDPNDATKTIVDWNAKVAIPSCLSYFKDKAATWASRYLEQLANSEPVFSNDWQKYLMAYSQKFEPLDKEIEAKAQLAALKQGNSTFTEYASQFDAISPLTKYSEQDLYEKMLHGLNETYIEELGRHTPMAKDLATLRQHCLNNDFVKQTISNTKRMAAGKMPIGVSSSSKSSSIGLRDSNAMDIDATIAASQFGSPPSFPSLKGLSDYNARKAKHSELMRGCCKTCGSADTTHNKATKGHDDPICSWCGKKGHWKRICISYLADQPRKANIRATNPDDNLEIAINPPYSSPSASSSQSTLVSVSATSHDQHGADIAALKDMIASQSKALAELTNTMSKSF